VLGADKVREWKTYLFKFLSYKNEDKLAHSSQFSPPEEQKEAENVVEILHLLLLDQQKIWSEEAAQTIPI